MVQHGFLIIFLSVLRFLSMDCHDFSFHGLIVIISVHHFYLDYNRQNLLQKNMNPYREPLDKDLDRNL